MLIKSIPRRFTLEERKIIENCLRNKMKYYEIARLLDRSRSSITIEIQRTNGGDYIADDIHKRVQENIKYQHHEAFSMRTLREEINKIKMQIDILTEEVMEIRKYGN